MNWFVLARLVTVAVRFFRSVAGRIRHVAGITLEYARRVVIYLCLASVILTGWVLDRIDPDRPDIPENHDK